MYRILTAHGVYNLARAFIGAVLVIYLVNHGISLSVIALAKAAQLVVSVLFNYPAGLISDKYGNKLTILLACIAEIIYFALMLHPSEQGVIIGEMFNGLGIALYTGAYEAWIFTHKKDKEDSFSLISRSAEMLFIATIISGVIGAVFAQYSLLLSLIFMAISFTAYAFTPEKKKDIPSVSVIESKYSGLSKLFRTADMNVLNFIVIGGLMQLLYQFWPLFFKNSPIGFSQKEVGLVFAASMVAQWAFTAYARKKNFNKKRYATTVCYLGVLFSSLATLLSPIYCSEFSYFIVILYCLFISFCTLTTNFFFSRSCNLYSNSKDESSMISLLDTGARCLGALCLALVSLLNMENISFIWLMFPVFVLLVAVTRLSKRVLSYGL
ncbi:MFS transporter [Kosakonia sp. 1610]|uniref:MFS transporter n=1 Tax=Kosakonia sp. 1610 TaxID=3156426 RepID=UPI003D20C159